MSTAMPLPIREKLQSPRKNFSLSSMHSSQFIVCGLTDTFSTEIRFLIGTLPRAFTPSVNWIGQQLPQSASSFLTSKTTQPTLINVSVGGNVAPSNGGNA